MKSPLTTDSFATIFLATFLSLAAGYGDTDGADFLTWQRQLSSAPLSAGQAANVPEPGTFALLACALVISVGWVKKA